MGGIGGLVLGEEWKENVEIGGNFGDHGPIDLGEESSEQRRLAAAAAEQLDDADPLMALDGGPERVDRLDRAADRGREADAIVGAEDVVIHRLGHGNDGHRSEEHTSELQSLMRISYAVFCLKKKTKENIKQ